VSSQLAEPAIPLANDYLPEAAPASSTLWRFGRMASLSTLLPAVAAAVALLVHTQVPSQQSDLPTRIYPLLLRSVIGLSCLATLLQWPLPWLGRWVRPRAPIWAVGVLTACGWDLITLKYALMPLPYFPGPDMVFQALADEWQDLLFERAFRSLTLLATGYTVGVVLGLASGILIGWSRLARYWAMPLIKFVGPIPATAWIPLAMMLFPTSFQSGTALIALAVWFPMTMLTSSGVSNVRVSYLDVARTLGAGRGYLVFRVAVPSALPNIFIGLFMGLVSSFLTLIVAEMMGVKSGLGEYVQWKKDWAEYANVYAALIVIAVVFSTLMTLLFKIRDRVLVWQKGVIKW
jgi:NitT/TauT family transport system permease protein